VTPASVQVLGAPRRPRSTASAQRQLRRPRRAARRARHGHGAQEVPSGHFCGGAGTRPGGPATSRATTNAQPAIPTTAYQVQDHVVSVLNGAKSVHVKGSYTWPHFRIKVDVGLLSSPPRNAAGLVSGSRLAIGVH